jgi:hypothetical protein
MSAKVENNLSLEELFDDHVEFVKDMNFQSVQEYKWYVRDFGVDLPSEISLEPEVLFEGLGFTWCAFFGVTPDRNIESREYMSLSEARYLMARLNIKKKSGSGKGDKRAIGLSKLIELGLLPSDFPSNYDEVYASQGYKSVKDLFGYDSRKKMATIEQAKSIVSRFNLSSSTQYTIWHEKHHENFDINMPSNPQSTYGAGKGWADWDDFLSRPEGASKDRMLSFEKARDYMRAVGLKGVTQWEEWKRSGAKPAFIPSSPHRVYKEHGWKGIPDFLGYNFDYGNKTQGTILRFEEAQAQVVKLNLDTRRAYMNWHAKVKPKGFPSRPDTTYKNSGFTDWAGFLGCERKSLPTELESEADLEINNISLSAVFVKAQESVLDEIKAIPVPWGSML